jgi:hypothetical protein
LFFFLFFFTFYYIIYNNNIHISCYININLEKNNNFLFILITLAQQYIFIKKLIKNLINRETHNTEDKMFEELLLLLFFISKDRLKCMLFSGEYSIYPD